VSNAPSDELPTDLSMLGASYSPLALIERERHVLSQIAAGVPLAQVLDELLRAVESQSGNSMKTSVLVLSEDGQFMLHGAGPGLPPGYNDAVHGIPVGEGIGSCGTAVARRAPVYVHDIASDPLWKEYASLAVGYGLRSCWSMPIKGADGVVLGTFAIYYSEPRAPTPGDVDAINVIAQTAALAIERYRSDLSLVRSQEKLRLLNADLERRVHERARERSRTWLVSPDLLSVINSEGLFDAVNPAWTATLGWSEEELLSGREDLVHPDDATRSAAVFQLARQGRPITQFKNRYRHRNGSYRWLVWVVVLEDEKLYCTARDITVEKTRAAALKARTKERDRAWNLSQELLAVVTAEGILDSVNARWTQQLGWDEAELIGSLIFDYIHPDDMDASLLVFNKILSAPLDTPFEYRLRHKDGSYRWFSWTGSPQDGKVYAAGRHVTAERAQAEALRQSQKMEAIGQLTGGVAHDFNNLLTVIRSSTDLLQRPNLSEERRARYVAAISDTVDRASKLTAQLLAFARRQALQPEVFAACDGVRSIAEMLGTLTGARITIVTHLPEQVCLVNADPSQFDTALVNMAVNARDAMNGEGTLTITVAPVEKIPAVRHHAAVHGAFVAISIADTGSGIAADRLDHVFEPFYTTKEVGQGTGLGLSQVLGFAKQSGGDVTLSSTVGKGSTFVLYLPRVATAVRSTLSPVPANLLEEGQGTRVLVVEDNVDVGSFSIQALAELGYAPVLAVNALEALAMLGAGEAFDVVFSDVVMPGMSGIELRQEIRRLYPTLPVVLTSGYSHVLAEHGAQGLELLQKPYSIDQLSRVLRKAAGRHVR